MKLFELKNHVVEFSPQALLLEPLKKIWTRDKSKSKTIARAELGFIWYMEDVRSDFYDIMDADERQVEILKYLTALPKGWNPDEVIKDASIFYIKHSETTSMKFLKDTMIMINNMRGMIRTMDFNERDKSGKLVHDYGKAMDSATKIPNLLRTLKAIYREVEKEADEENMMRGGRQKAAFEDGI